ncbi:hypothetical protein MUP51_04405, partial [Candidatus Bathyarchaeota archaeon]|nr:hypothetical protein [Candidatus Bathyarchaeota archaeon]
MIILIPSFSLFEALFLAAREYWSMIKDVFSNRNILAISLTTSLWSLVQQGWSPFWPKYMK